LSRVEQPLVTHFALASLRFAEIRWSVTVDYSSQVYRWLERVRANATLFRQLKLLSPLFWLLGESVPLDRGATGIHFVLACDRGSAADLHPPKLRIARSIRRRKTVQNEPDDLQLPFPAV
jgi:hypothetical protein